MRRGWDPPDGREQGLNAQEPDLELKWPEHEGEPMIPSMLADKLVLRDLRRVAGAKRPRGGKRV